MQRWISILLLLSFVRLQLVCCCGSIGGCAQKIENEAVWEHCCGDCHAPDCHDLEIACDSAEVGTIEAGTIEAFCPCGDCLHCENSSHHPIFLISNPFVGLAHDHEIQKTIVVHQFIDAVVPVVSGKTASISDPWNERISRGLGSRALLMLAQLRI